MVFVNVEGKFAKTTAAAMRTETRLIWYFTDVQYICLSSNPDHIEYYTGMY